MLTTLRDADGRIQLSAEWWTVDATGRWYGRGPYVFVNHLEISRGADGVYLIQQLIRTIAEAEPQAKSAFWTRRHGQRDKVREYTRQQMERKGVLIG